MSDNRIHPDQMRHPPTQSAAGLEKALRDPNTPLRDRTWDECGIEEKVERLRHELLHTLELAQHLAVTAQRADMLAREHQHSRTGEVLQSINRVGAMAGTLAGEGMRWNRLR